jgi:hypothetical protein
VTKHPGGSTGGSTPSTCRSRNKFRGAGRSGLICTDPLCALAVSPSRSRPAWAGSSLGAPARALAAISSRSSAKVLIAAASGGGVAGSSRFSRYCAVATSDKRASTATVGVADGVSGPGGVGLQRHPGAHRGVGGAGPRLGVGDLLVGERRPGPHRRAATRPTAQRRSSSPVRRLPRRCLHPDRHPGGRGQLRRRVVPQTAPSKWGGKTVHWADLYCGPINSACAVRWLC